MASVRLKPLSRQVVVITGATSGIGLATARMASARGAKVVAVARNEDALRDLVAELRGRGGQAEYVVADVADRPALEAAASKAQDVFGRLDSWVNDAGSSTYGTLEQTSEDDHRKVFETNYWGVVHGSLIAARELRARGGGALINVGSILSDRAILLQGPYCATKHAVKAFTDALRMELERDGAPISVTLIKPSGIDTGFFEHAKNLTDSPGLAVPPPAYDPKLVARAICYACEHPKRDIVIGFGGHAIALLGAHFPRLTDKVMEAVGYQMQTTDKAPRAARANSLHAPKADGTERSETQPNAMVRKTSLFLEMQINPLATAVTLAGLGALMVGALAARGLGKGRVVVTDPGTYTAGRLRHEARLLGREARRQAGRLL